MDKLKGRITESEYDRFFQTFCQQRHDITGHLDRLQRTETNYYITAKFILDLAKRASELFESSEVEEKRQLIKLLLSNVRIEGENVVYNVQKPYEALREVWRPIGDYFRTFSPDDTLQILKDEIAFHDFSIIKS